MKTRYIILILVAGFVFWKWKQCKAYVMNFINGSMRKNNPLNIRHTAANHWKGELVDGNTKEGAFCIFDTLENGIRAAIINMHSYVKEGISTPEAVIAKWAPPSDNNDDKSYLETVNSRLPENFVLSEDYNSLATLAWAMSGVEVGIVNAPPKSLFETVVKNNWA